MINRPLCVLSFLVATTAFAAPRKNVRPSAPPPPPAPVAAPVVEQKPLQHGALHVEFGETELKGQAAKGAVTLVERPEMGVRSFLHSRTDFRAQVAATIQ